MCVPVENRETYYHLNAKRLKGAVFGGIHMLGGYFFTGLKL